MPSAEQSLWEAYIAQPESSDCEGVLRECLQGVSPWTGLDDNAWGVGAKEREAWLEIGKRIFPQALLGLSELFEKALRPEQIAELYWSLWLPVSLRIRDQLQKRSAKGGAYVQGVFGIQGTGKSTLSGAARAILSQLDIRAEILSLDDIYLTLAERQTLRTQDARFSHRGPPGTHDIALGMQVLKDARAGVAGQPDRPALALPRFDKSIAGGQGDRVAPLEVGQVDVLFFEGWFLGVPSVDDRVFADAPPPIVSDEDRSFARDSNARLALYEPLWAEIDDLIALIPTDYSQGRAWRHRAEEVMRNAGRESMDVSETDRFIDYCWKAVHPAIFVDALLRNPQSDGIAVEILPSRKPGVVRRIARATRS